jgi:hypothetical protein
MIGSYQSTGDIPETKHTNSAHSHCLRRRKYQTNPNTLLGALLAEFAPPVCGRDKYLLFVGVVEQRLLRSAAPASESQWAVIC